MNPDYTTVVIAAILQGLVVLYIETRMKKTIEHKFDRKLEEMRQAFSREMADRERQDKFRLAGLDERLAAHQKAFTLARKMYLTLHRHDEEFYKVLRECEDFWDLHALYLTEEARQLFRKGLNTYHTYGLFADAWREDRKNPKRSEDLERAFNVIENLQPGLIKIVDREWSGDRDYLKDQSLSPFEEK